MSINASISAILGIFFAVLGTATVFLMFHLWGYPFDKATRTSAAPKGLMIFHRVLGFLFAGLYLFMMARMVPRLLSYQVEFPARTVVHICLGITIGFLLLVKVSIIRFFRHLEEWMPFLGTGILLCTYLLIGLSVPFAFRERSLQKRALGGGATSAANIERLKRVLPEAGLPKDAKIDELASEKGLNEGRQVLLTRCVSCHDLKTVLTRPRSPKDWVQTVERMAEKPVYGEAISEKEQWKVAAYLVAIGPDLQQSAKKARAQREQSKDAKVGAVVAMEGMSDVPLDSASVKTLFETKCSQCHELTDVDKHVWKGPDDAKEVMERMVDNGLEATPEELNALRQYLVVSYVKEGSAPAPKPTPPPVAMTATPTTTASASAKKTPGAKPATTTAATTAEPAPTPPPAAAEGSGEATCGKKPLPDCPMQAWMKQNAAAAGASDDGAALAAVFDRIGKLAPPGYGNWASIANEGASAARSGDVKAARGACSSCHNAYRAKYKSEMRARPLR